MFLNDAQMKLLKLTSGEKLILSIGAVELQVEVAPQSINSSTNMIYLSSKVLEDLYFYQGESLMWIYYGNKKLVLGPAIGVTIAYSTWKKIKDSRSIEKRALLALKKGILLYYFILKRVDWENNLVKAYCLNPKNHKWVKKTVPVPQVIIDRGSYPSTNTMESFTHKGKVKNIQWINTTRTFGKWETYQALVINTDTKRLLPETTMLTLSKLLEFLNKYRYCYIKSNYGRSGRQVMRIEKVGNDYICKKGGSEVISWTFNDLQQALAFLYSRLGNNLILQQGIYLSEIDGCPFDMRILVQKNANNRWVISALNFRIASLGAIVTNFSAGARDIFLSRGQELFHPDLSWNRLRLFTMKTIRALEGYFGRLGEVGLDVALDKDNKLWLLEANSRPSSIAYRDASHRACMEIYGLQLDYACSLIKNLYGHSTVTDKPLKS